MSYVVLARKWRPQSLTDILGQEHVTRTIRNAISSGRIAQTFLFSGPRGVGKTSAARILAKTLCCEASDSPTAEPCGQCRQCVAIAEGSSTDVIEIDAASHTGVDNVREVIVESVRYLPSSARYKVYIIDEVHMLSSSSFNALLKTFEEPPAHVKFVLATTEIHKVPVTILSRCQRYDFRLIASARIQERLSYILKEEKVEHDQGALALVSRMADGSMRDAQSLMEQVLAYAGDRPLEGALVRDALGVVDSGLIETTLDGIFERRPEVIFRAVEEVHHRGLGHARFSASLVEHVRDLVVAAVMPEPAQAIDRPPDEITTLVSRAKSQRLETLERLFELLCRLQEEVVRASQPRYVLEVGLAKLASEPPAIPLDKVLSQLDRLEQQLAGGSMPSTPSGPVPSSRGPGEAYAKYSPRGSSPGEKSSGTSPEGRPKGPLKKQVSYSGPSQSYARNSGPRGRQSSPPIKAKTSSNDSSDGSSDPAPRSPDSAHPGTSTRPGPSRSVLPDESEPSSRKSPRFQSPHPTSDLEQTPKYQPSGPNPDPIHGSTAMPMEENPKRGELLPKSRTEPLEKIETRYRRFVEAMAQKRPALAATLHQVRPLKFDATHVHLVCETAFDGDKLAEPETKRALESAVDGFFGCRVPLEVSRQRMPPTEVSTKPRTLVEADDQERAARIADKLSRARTRPAVKAVIAELGASIGRVRVLGEDDSTTGKN